VTFSNPDPEYVPEANAARRSGADVRQHQTVCEVTPGHARSVTHAADSPAVLRPGSSRRPGHLESGTTAVWATPPTLCRSGGCGSSMSGVLRGGKQGCRPGGWFARLSTG
jgi:hypothetical protein